MGVGVQTELRVRRDHCTCVCVFFVPGFLFCNPLLGYHFLVGSAVTAMSPSSGTPESNHWSQGCPHAAWRGRLVLDWLLEEMRAADKTAWLQGLGKLV